MMGGGRIGLLAGRDVSEAMSDNPILTISVPTGPWRVLQPGNRITFGRSDVDQDEQSGTVAHLGLSHNPRLHRLAGQIEVDGTGWLLTNTGRWLHLRVVELDGPNGDRSGVPGDRRVIRRSRAGC
jgi:hypothetical protein